MAGQQGSIPSLGSAARTLFWRIPRTLLLLWTSVTIEFSTHALAFPEFPPLSLSASQFAPQQQPPQQSLTPNNIDTSDPTGITKIVRADSNPTKPTEILKLTSKPKTLSRHRPSSRRAVLSADPHSSGSLPFLSTTTPNTNSNTPEHRQDEGERRHRHHHHRAVPRPRPDRLRHLQARLHCTKRHVQLLGVGQQRQRFLSGRLIPGGPGSRCHLGAAAASSAIALAAKESSLCLFAELQAPNNLVLILRYLWHCI